EAAEEVCDGELDTLASLLDKSLLRHETGRYAMLETIHEFARERLQESGEQERLGTRHAAYFLALAEQVEQPFEEHESPRGSALRRLLDALAHEYDNLWTALNRAVQRRARELALRLAAAARPLLFSRTVAEARKSLKLALAVEGVSSPLPEAKVLRWAS